MTVGPLHPHPKGNRLELGAFAFKGYRVLTLYPVHSGRLIPSLWIPEAFVAIRSQWLGHRRSRKDVARQGNGLVDRLARIVVGSAVEVGKAWRLTRTVILSPTYLEWRIEGEEVLLWQAQEEQVILLGHRQDA